MKKGINQEGKNVFEDLGYSISFFSSMDESDSCAFQMTVGNRNDQFYNTFLLNLPLSLNLYDKKTADMIRAMFEKIVLEYRPFWRCASNKILSRKYGQYLHGNIPTTVHCLNYWSEEIIQAIGVEKINKLLAHNTLISFQNGVLSNKETAIDTDNEEDIILHEKLQNYFFPDDYC